MRRDKGRRGNGRDKNDAAALLSVKRDKAYRLLAELARRNKLTCQKVHGTNYYRLFGV